MDSSSFLEDVLRVLDDFSKKIPNGLISVSTNINEKDCSSVIDLNSAVQQLHKDLKKISDKNVEQQKELVNHNTVQITASKAQLDRRMLAFISHAQNAVDQQNIEEFFPNKDRAMSEMGCARTNAVYRRRPSSRTHVQVNKVINSEGPQTQINSQGHWCAVKRERPIEPISCPNGIQERLNNLEEHIGIKNFSSGEVYSRLKALEDKVLSLEAISPEYFNESRNLNKPPVLQGSSPQQMSIDQIDDRIRLLKRKISSKRAKIE